MDLFEIIGYLIIYMGCLEFGFIFWEANNLRSKTIEYFGVKRPIKILYKLFRCDFCLSFWMIVIVYGIFEFVGTLYYFIPIAAVGWFWYFNKRNK